MCALESTVVTEYEYIYAGTKLVRMIVTSTVDDETPTVQTIDFFYDDNGNIVSVSDGTNTTTYVYDTLNQLVRENNEAADKTWVYSYDSGGNITSKEEYAYTTDKMLSDNVVTVNYTYGDAHWGDLLTAYNGVNITYDGIGNPLNDGTWTYTWENGRQLASMTSGATTWSYKYNADGLRTERSNGTVTYEYIYSGSTLIQMAVGNDTLYFTYDASGTPMAVTFNDTKYFYATNLQGDIIAILDTNGNAVVEYTYDAWGNILTATDSTLGNLNPLRYRGYVYDIETKFYYLQSRYYDPEMGRFISADALVSTGQGILGYNMFAYCRNSPVFRIDISGTCDVECGDENPMNDEESNNDFGPGGTNNSTSTGANSGGYSSPPGGGGVTNRIQIGVITVEFGHGARHLQNTGLTINQVEAAIAQNVVNANIPINTYYPGHIQIGNGYFKYSGFRLSENRINIGTYYLEHY